MEISNIKTKKTWQEVLSSEFEKAYFQHLSEFVKNECTQQQVCPQTEDIFQAFIECPYDRVKVVILGQDPYHGTEQANGLCFAVCSGVKIPPSLKNIFKEIESDTGIKCFKDGDLSRWAKQGILLLNSTLTVRANQPGSHQGKGWEEFTDTVIQTLSDQNEHIVFLLWGNYAKKKGVHIDRNKHLVLEASHPSPFSVHTGFFGCKHFSKTNAYLREHGLHEIDWR